MVDHVGGFIMRKWILFTALVTLLGGGFLGFILGHSMGYSRALDMWGGRFVERQLVEAGTSNALMEVALDSDCGRVAGAARTFVINSAMAMAWLLPYLEGFDLDRAQRYIHNALSLLDRHAVPSETDMKALGFVKRRLAASEE